MLQWAEPPSDKTEIKIRSFRNSKLGWHYGEGVPANKNVIEIASQLNQTAIQVSFLESAAFLGVSGEIQVVFYHKDDSFEFTIETDCKITFIHEINRDIIEEREDINLDEAIGTICDHRPWLYYDLSSSVIGNPKKADSVVLNSNRQVATVAYPWLKKNALKNIEPNWASVSVKGFGVTIRSSDLSQSFFGDSTQGQSLDSKDIV